MSSVKRNTLRGVFAPAMLYSFPALAGVLPFMDAGDGLPRESGGKPGGGTRSQGAAPLFLSRSPLSRKPAISHLEQYRERGVLCCELAIPVRDEVDRLARVGEAVSLGE